jgi:1,2-dihydroxy-3-keto-5-methylthiopentene dioxygenase
MAIEQAPEETWPEAWLMPETVEDPCEENRLGSSVAVTAHDLKKLGIAYWKMEDTDEFEYPIKAVPWDPKDATDPKLMQLRDDRGYSYADIITIHPDHLPDFENKIKSFFEEHIHDAEEIRFILGGSGYFDVRNAQDQWVRIHVKKGDLMTLPEGIYHRFTCDTNRTIHAMRLFQGQPIWTPFNRPQEEHESRKKYAAEFVASQ